MDLKKCAAMGRPKTGSPFQQTIRNGPEQMNCHCFRPALCNVRRWLRKVGEGDSLDIIVDISVLADVLAPPECYRRNEFLADEEQAVYSAMFENLMTCECLKKYIVACRITGSQSEALTMVGDDDYMWMTTSVVGDVVPTEHPGYYYVRKSPGCLLPVTDSTGFVRNDEVKKWPMLYYFDKALLSGPAVTSLQSVCLQEEDNIVALLCDDWPTNFDRQPFVDSMRRKLQHFVTAAAVRSTCTMPLYLVPVSHPTKRDDVYGWRLTFSLHERKILNNFINPERKRVYCLLRIIIWNAKPLSQALAALKTYHIKTEFLWLASETRDIGGECNGWSFLEKFIQLCEKLETAFMNKRLSNFFIPDQNLIGHLKERRLRPVANWIRSHLLCESGRRETFLAVLHGQGCENMRIVHSPSRNAIADCAAAFIVAMTVPNSVGYSDYYGSLLHQVARLLPPAGPSFGDDEARLPVDDASVRAVFEMHRLLRYVAVRESCCMPHSSTKMEFLSIACVQILDLAWVSNDAIIRIDDGHRQRMIAKTQAVQKKRSLNVQRSKPGVKRCNKKVKEKSTARKYTQLKKTTKYDKPTLSYNWRLAKTLLLGVPFNNRWRHVFCAELQLFQGDDCLTKFVIESEILPIWVPSEGEYLVNYVNLGNDLLFVLHAFRCYRSSGIVQFALHYLNWLDMAPGYVDCGSHTWLYQNKTKALYELVDNLRPHIDPDRWDADVQPFIDRNKIALMRREVVTFVLCRTAELQHRNDELRHRCAIMRQVILSRSQEPLLDDHIQLTPFETTIITCNR